jgi:hypothetical protein
MMGWKARDMMGWKGVSGLKVRIEYNGGKGKYENEGGGGGDPEQRALSFGIIPEQLMYTDTFYLACKMGSNYDHEGGRGSRGEGTYCWYYS